MVKKLLVNSENPNGIEIELTAEEETQRQASLVKCQEDLAEENNEKQAKADLKASAKAKLIAGEKLTEEEANILVGV